MDADQGDTQFVQCAPGYDNWAVKDAPNFCSQLWLVAARLVSHEDDGNMWVVDLGFGP